MTTPSEGPGWQQGEWLRATDWLANLSQEQQQNLTQFVGMAPDQRQAAMNFVNLDDRQQANLMRAANTDPLRDRVNNAIRGAVARVHLAYDNTQQRLSEGAVALQAQARGYRDAAVEGVTGAYQGARDMAVQGARNARDMATEAGQQVAGAYNRGVERATEVGQQVGQQVAGAYNRGVDRATEAGQQVAGAYQQGRDRVVDAAQRGQVRLDQAWQTGADRLNQTGQNIAQGARDARDTAVGLGRDARDAVRAAPGKAGRWFEGKFNGTMLKAESALNSYNAARHSPPLQADTAQVMGDKDRLALIQQVSENLNSPISAEENEAIQNLAQTSQARLETQTAARAGLTGVAPASQAAVQGQAAALGQQPGDGAQQQTGANVTKNTENPGIKR